ncbi:MAG TPA: hypothetical protein VLH35_03575 [Candidatus Acidoferrales bacterium]|nr:hypothetical protein [Candidatus Acidoferrales bacterium]
MTPLEAFGEIRRIVDKSNCLSVHEIIKLIGEKFTSTNKPSVEISALLDKAFDLAFDLGGNAELLTCIRLAQKLSHVG